MSDKCLSIRKFLPECIKKPLRKIRIKIKRLTEFPTICMQPYRHKKALEKLRIKSKNHKVRVTFFAIHSSVWKYDGVYKLLEQDERFEPIVMVCPVIDHGVDNMKYEMDKTYDLMISKGYNVIKTYTGKNNNFLDVKKEINPDIVFFTNPHGLTRSEYYIKNFKDTLTCYVQYSFHITHLNIAQYDQLFHNLIWRAFYETKIHEKIAMSYARNRGENVIVSGYPGIDDFFYNLRSNDNVWKNPNDKLKRIIWAPHHTIDFRENLGLSNFLRYHQFMLDLCEKYEDCIQIAFKPHPLLKVKLYEHVKWGKKLTDLYFKKWDSLNNGQLETDDYVGLFNSSDAMILDSASFMTEYLCCGKPSLFTIADRTVEDRFNEFGKMVFEQLYHAYNETQIIAFIDNVVLAENDIFKEKRDKFYSEFLLPPNKSASQNIYEEICSSIWSG